MVQLVGTPFPDDDTSATESAPVWKQVATDEQGRRRFHGAFTGGFSAGYFNTVGSKEGWTPSTFRSSRDSRGRVRQTAQDFMDEEDHQLFGASKLAAKADFDAETANAQMAAALPQSGLLPAELVIPNRDGIGLRLLRMMGWREGHGIGPRRKRSPVRPSTPPARVYGPARPANLPATSDSDETDSEDVHAAQHEFAPRDIGVIVPSAKADTYGLGYDPIAGAGMVFEEARARHKQQTTTKKQAGFGLGAFEEDDDDDIYAQPEMSRYDISLGEPMVTDVHMIVS